MENQDVTVMDHVYHLSFVLQTLMTRLAAVHDLSVTQVRLLGILRDHEPTMQVLAEHLSLGKSSLSGLIDRAEERGLVERIHSGDDRRATHVRITSRGRKMIKVIAKGVQESMAPKLLADLTEADKAALLHLVGKVLDSYGRVEDT